MTPLYKKKQFFSFFKLDLTKQNDFGFRKLYLKN